MWIILLVIISELDGAIINGSKEASKSKEMERKTKQQCNFQLFLFVLKIQ